MWGKTHSGCFPMKEKDTLIKKVKHLLKKVQAPKYLHRFGPKTYKLWQHVFALFVKAHCQLSYRRTTKFLRLLGFTVATKSTLQRYSAKLKLPFWQKMLQKTFSSVTDIVAIDGTGLEKTRVSEHYIKRIDGKSSFGKGFHFSILTGTNGKIFCLRLRKRYGHDVKDIKCLFRNLLNKPKIALMDKGYDAEWIHKMVQQRGIRSIAPVRKNAKRGFYRLNLKRKFPQKIYNKRNIVESIFHAFKQKYGSSVSSKKISSARTEVYCKAILHNIILKINQLLGHTRKRGLLCYPETGAHLETRAL